MYPTRGLTRRLAAIGATGALAAGLAAPAQADPPGDRPSWAPVTASVRPDDRADRTRTALVARAIIRPDDRADRTGPPVSVAAPSTLPPTPAIRSRPAMSWVALVVTAIGLGIGAMVYTQRLGSA